MTIIITTNSAITGWNEKTTLEAAIDGQATLTRCQLPLDAGVCQGTTGYKWGFTEKTKSCDMFAYSGCGGNENQFDSLATCTSACFGKYLRRPLAVVLCWLAHYCMHALLLAHYCMHACSMHAYVRMCACMVVFIQAYICPYIHEWMCMPSITDPHIKAGLR